LSLLGSIAEGYIARVGGPMSLRFVFQPLIGLLLGARDGMVDAKAGEPPFILGLLHDCVNRRARIERLFKSLFKTIIIAICLDMIVQYILFDQIKIGAAVITAVIILIVPYSLARATINMIVTKRKASKLGQAVKEECALEH
jgi:biotin transporter BioY